MGEKRKRFYFCLRISLGAYACAFAACFLAGMDTAWEEILASIFLCFVLLGAAASGIAGRYSDFGEEISPEELEELQKMICDLKKMRQEAAQDKTSFP